MTITNIEHINIRQQQVFNDRLRFDEIAGAARQRRAETEAQQETRQTRRAKQRADAKAEQRRANTLKAYWRSVR